MVFTLVALSWVLRVNFPYERFSEIPLEFLLSSLQTWYELVGWAAVDNAIFAVVQAILLCSVRYQEESDEEGASDSDETTPLLQHE